MINQHLLDFIKLQLSQGKTRDLISKELLANGWAPQDIEEGFSSPTLSINPTPKSSTTPSQSSELRNNSPKKRSILNPFSFQGRMNRKTFFWSSVVWFFAPFTFGIFVLIISVAMISTGLAVTIAGSRISNPLLLFNSLSFVGDCLLIIAGLAFIFVLAAMFISSIVKRFHDLNKSGSWYWAVNLVPIWNLYLFLSLFCESGTEGSNQFGDDPLPLGSKRNGFFDRIGKSFLWKTVVLVMLFGFLIALGAIISKVSPQSNQNNVDYNLNHPTIILPVSTNTAAPQIDTSSSSQTKVDTSNWLTTTVHVSNTPSSICYSIKYPPILKKSPEDNSSYVDSNGNGILATVDWDDTLEKVVQYNVSGGLTVKDFQTKNGINGKEVIYQGQPSSFYFPTSNSGKIILITIEIVKGENTSAANPIDKNTFEAIAHSMIASCPSSS